MNSELWLNSKCLLFRFNPLLQIYIFISTSRQQEGWYSKMLYMSHLITLMILPETTIFKESIATSNYQ